MKYMLKKTNYRIQGLFSENTLAARSYFIPYSSVDALKDTDILKERYSSPLVTVLSGDWDFRFYKKCARVPDVIDTSRLKFDKIHVPSVWQRTGYLEPVYLNWRYEFTTKIPTLPEDMPAGIYRKKFTIDDISKSYILTFLGFANNFELYINGEYAGYAEGTHNTHEFDITEYLTEGENELVCLSYRWSTGTYLEAQDMFRENGIIRDVLLTKRGSSAIDDIAFDYEKTGGAYNAECSVKIAGETAGVKVKASLYDGENIICEQTADAEDVTKFDFSSLNVTEWNAEKPKTYTLYITLLSDGGEIESARQTVGFKRVEIDGSLFKFNDKLIKFKGVNHHDTNETRGYCMTHDDYLLDIKLMKQFNVNAVRTSHYPPDPIMLTLCDIYGLYVIDEADIETHGAEDNCGDPNAISDHKKWEAHYIDRVHSMYERDKNHPCVTMWSLGNESGWLRNHVKCYEYLKSRGTTIPVHYEGACSSKIYGFDVISRMYPSPDEVDKIGQKKYGTKPSMKKAYSTKPLFLCEYAHAMGFGPGSLEDYFKLFLKYDNVTGGCIWEWADHAVLHAPDDSKYPYKYTYGGDHGEKRHDGNFCVDGLFYPDRHPHTGAYEMKNCYRPVRAEKTSDNTYAFTNTNRFASTDSLIIKWSLEKDGISVDGGEFAADIQPESTKEITINHLAADDSANWAVNFTYVSDGAQIASEQIIINTHAFTPCIEKSEKITLSCSDSLITAAFDSGKAVFDEKNGHIISLIKNGREYLSQSPVSGKFGFAPNVFRAPLDNDRNIKSIWFRHNLNCLEEKLNNFTTEIADGRAVITADYSLIARGKSKLSPGVKKFGYSIKYSVGGSGDIKVTASLKKFTKMPLKLPRFGLIFEMPKEFSAVKYFGRGIIENLPDCNLQSPVGLYTQDIKDMHEDYIYPQDNSNHGDTRFLSIFTPDGASLNIYPDDAVNFSAHDYTQECLTEALHQEDIKHTDTSVISLDGFVRGSGTNSCGPETLSQYCIDEDKKLTFSFVITEE